MAIEHNDFDLLHELGAGTADARRLDDLWAKTRRLVDQLGDELFGAGQCHADLWPEGEGDDGERGPFLWARLKRAGNEGFATHVGIFLSPELCNLSVDLEKDLLDANRAAESLDQVLDFFRSELPAMTSRSAGGGIPAAEDAPVARMGLQIWTDTRNVVAADDFPALDFWAFMDANRDAGHPWPKIGYILSANDVAGFGDGDGWLDELRTRAVPLVAVYDAMIRSYAG